MGLPRQEYWKGFPFPPPGDVPHPEIKLESPASPALAGRFFTTEPKPRYRKNLSVCLVKYLRYAYSGILAIKNETLPYMTTRMNPEDIMLNEINQTQKDKFHMISLICKILHTHTHTYTHTTFSYSFIHWWTPQLFPYLSYY